MPPDSGALLARLREQQGLTQRELAAALDVSRLTVLRWENGQVRPSARLWQRLLELCDEAVETARGGEAPPCNLPLPPNALIGRDDDLAAIGELLLESRLVTLVGAGGCGKTRLALAASRTQLDRFPAGAWLVDLSSLSDPALVARAVASTLNIRDEAGIDLLVTLQSALRDRRTLLLLDNCEQVLAACGALVRSVLAACDQVRILATSREPLRLAGEAVFQVRPLAVSAATTATVESVAATPSAQLFNVRARERQAGFWLDENAAADVAAICRRLDGLPLALELAAAWTSVLPVAEIAARLDDRFRFLVRGAADAPDRHQTLRAAIGWSYGLLSDAEQRLFERLSAFPGGFDLNAARSIAAIDGVDDAELLGLVADLVDKSLLTAQIQGPRPRFAMLESLRAFGRERLEDGAAVTQVMQRLAAHYLRAAQEVRSGLQGGPQQQVLEEVTADLENYRAALTWLADRREWNDYLRLAGGIWRFWDITGAAGEAIYWLERGLQQLDAAIGPDVRARACTCLGESLWRRGSHGRAEELQRQALALYLDCEDTSGAVIALTNLGGVAFARPDYAAARVHWERALAIARESDSKRQVGILLNNLGLLADRAGDPAAAEQLLSKSAAIRRAIGDRAGLSSSLVNLASLAGRRGDDATVRTLCAEVLELAGSLGQHLQTGAALEEIARVEFRAGDMAGAEARAHEALATYTAIGHAPDAARMSATLATIARVAGRLSEAVVLHRQALVERLGIGDAMETAESLLGIASLALDLDASVSAARLLGAVSTIRAAGALPPGVERYEEMLRQVRTALTPNAFDRAFQRGAELALEVACTESLAWLERNSGAAGDRERAVGSVTGARGSRTVASLSRREAAVMELLAEGCTNREVAAKLRLSVRTVERHVANAYAKLGARRRADAIRKAMELQRRTSERP